MFGLRYYISSFLAILLTGQVDVLFQPQLVDAKKKFPFLCTKRKDDTSTTSNSINNKANPAHSQQPPKKMMKKKQKKNPITLIRQFLFAAALSPMYLMQGCGCEGGTQSLSIPETCTANNDPKTCDYDAVGEIWRKSLHAHYQAIIEDEREKLVNMHKQYVLCENDLDVMEKKYRAATAVNHNMNCLNADPVSCDTNSAAVPSSSGVVIPQSSSTYGDNKDIIGNNKDIIDINRGDHKDEEDDVSNSIEILQAAKDSHTPLVRAINLLNQKRENDFPLSQLYLAGETRMKAADFVERTLNMVKDPTPGSNLVYISFWQNMALVNRALGDLVDILLHQLASFKFQSKDRKKSESAETQYLKIADKGVPKGVVIVASTLIHIENQIVTPHHVKRYGKAYEEGSSGFLYTKTTGASRKSVLYDFLKNAIRYKNPKLMQEVDAVIDHYKFYVEDKSGSKNDKKLITPLIKKAVFELGGDIQLKNYVIRTSNLFSMLWRHPEVLYKFDDLTINYGEEQEIRELLFVWRIPRQFLSIHYERYGGAQDFNKLKEVHRKLIDGSKRIEDVEKLTHKGIKWKDVIDAVDLVSMHKRFTDIGSQLGEIDLQQRNQERIQYLEDNMKAIAELFLKRHFSYGHLVNAGILIRHHYDHNKQVRSTYKRWCKQRSQDDSTSIEQVIENEIGIKKYGMNWIPLFEGNRT